MTVYPVMDSTKVVYYWIARVLGGEFEPNDEVDEIRWLTFDDAKEIMSYDLDRQVLTKAEKRFSLPATSRILYVRQAKAHDREKWSGDDNKRPPWTRRAAASRRCSFQCSLPSTRSALTVRFRTTASRPSRRLPTS